MKSKTRFWIFWMFKLNFPSLFQKTPKPFKPIVQSTPMPFRRLTYHEMTISSISPVPRNQRRKSSDAAETTRYSARMSIETPKQASRQIEVVKYRKRTDRTSAELDETVVQNYMRPIRSCRNRLTIEKRPTTPIEIKEEPINIVDSEATTISSESNVAEKSEATSQLIIDENAQNSNVPEVEQSKSQSSVSSALTAGANTDNEVADIFMNAEYSHDSENDSFWNGRNPFDALPNFRLRNQSIENTFTRQEDIGSGKKKLEVVKAKRVRPKRPKIVEKVVQPQKAKPIEPQKAPTKEAAPKDPPRPKSRAKKALVEIIEEENPQSPAQRVTQKAVSVIACTQKSTEGTEKEALSRTAKTPQKPARKTPRKDAEKALEVVEEVSEVIEEEYLDEIEDEALNAIEEEVQNPIEKTPQKAARKNTKKTPKATKVTQKTTKKTPRKTTEKAAEIPQILPNENYDMLEASQVIPKIRVRKTLKTQSEAPKTTKKSRKRKSSENIAETPEKKSRSSTIRSSTSSRDEGFHTDESAEHDEDFDVRYVPENSRYPFRKRRYLKPWWKHSGNTDERYELTLLTSAEVRAQTKVDKIRIKSGIDMKKIAGDPILQRRPTEQLEVVQVLAKEKKRTSRLAKSQSKEKSTKVDSSGYSSFSGDSSKMIAKAFQMRSGDEGFNVVEQYEGFGKNRKF